MRCAAYCRATSFDAEKLSTFLSRRYETTHFKDVLHIKLGKSPQSTEEGDIFIFNYAAIVFWGLEHSQELRILNELKIFECKPANKMCEDIFTFEYNHLPGIKEDNIKLPDKKPLTKLAFSQGIAQSVKLDTFENTIQQTVNLTKELPQYLAALGKINLSGTEIRRMMGRLFIDRHSINLHQELLDIPEFFWEYSELEPYYHMVANYLDIDRRVNVLNQRLTVLKELFDMLNNEVNHKHSTRLEWIIIWLIVIEVVLELLALYFK